MCNSHMLDAELPPQALESVEPRDTGETDGEENIFSPQVKEAPTLLDHVSAKVTTDEGTRSLTLLKPVRRDPLRFAVEPLRYSPDNKLELWWESRSQDMEDSDTVEFTLHIDVPQVDHYRIKLHSQPNTGTAMIELPDLLDQLCEEHHNSPQVRSRKALRRKLGLETCPFFVLWVDVTCTCSTDSTARPTLTVSTPPLRFCIDKD